MSIFTSSPYSYLVTELLVAKVRAHNERGWSDYSIANVVGVTAMTHPDTMIAPIRDAATSEYQVVVNWNSMVSPDNGDSAITSYNL
jgi:hypothetical protein